ncbi:NAD(P)H-dependent glycerol-3-phosphate dehydrogenase [Alicyclobacillus sp. ALC3]|uniref:NAD(P)H-dependent glycerol-3-phosphate dehydrogenase n=1 Tax=Alicyclobacillus sp. ALC3 TaxID=2796143 RepID=UPI0023797CFC|nr:NAD(P)H-dependent glycerol-3-phosphate dehydrogenase [Alicyclobacillus sp. ALC3]WDL97132.1 NAD(P)H-dependent glycerol-3-phosphate dehydrogenase [Alicyclobacillus sp. ALC3]
MKVAIYGAGSWGTALASVFAANGHDTVLWARSDTVCDEINERQTNHRYLPDAQLPGHLKATVDLDVASKDAELCVLCVPSAAVSSMVTTVAPFLPRHALIGHAVKGFDAASKRTVSQVLLDAVLDAKQRLFVIAGPSHAEEVVARMPTTLVVAGYGRATAESAQDALMNQYMRVYTNPDVIGAELGGALKNIIALSVGLADGLGFGDNAKAALITRGLTEIARLGVRMGASLLTFAGLAGIGDVFVTCSSRHSRNFRAGRLLGQGYSLPEALDAVGMVVEGVPTTQTTVTLSKDYGVEMPITNALASVLFEGQDPVKAVEQLMGRARSHEIEEVASADIAPKWEID